MFNVPDEKMHQKYYQDILAIMKQFLSVIDSGWCNSNVR